MCPIGPNSQHTVKNLCPQLGVSIVALHFLKNNSVIYTGRCLGSEIEKVVVDLTFDSKKERKNTNRIFSRNLLGKRPPGKMRR
jgi:endonuclease I